MKEMQLWNAVQNHLYKWNLLYNVGCHRIWQILDEEIKSRAVQLIKMQYGLVSLNIKPQ